MKPNKKCEVKANLEVKGKNYTGNQDMCVQDSCKSLLILLFGLVTDNRTWFGTDYEPHGVVYIIEERTRLRTVQSYFASIASKHILDMPPILSK